MLAPYTYLAPKYLSPAAMIALASEAAETDCVEAAATTVLAFPETLMDWPTLSLLAFVMLLFKESNLLTVVLYFLAIPESVSPDFILYAVVETDLLELEELEVEALPETVRVCPTEIRSAFLIVGFSFCNVLTDTLYFLAIALNVSTTLTVYCFVLEELDVFLAASLIFNFCPG